jgi:1,2-dihydroxy-3-keto-5-methylthiopentene dioxygenase
MSRLHVYDLDTARVVADLEDGADIADRLTGIDVRFERWEAPASLAPGATQDEILAAYADPLDRILDEGGFTTADVVSLQPDHPDRDALRRKFLDEHTHTEDEVRFFVDGAGAFYLRDDRWVHRVVCERGDLLSVPADTRHWFDMGPTPRFTAIRVFTDPAGWVGHFTGDTVSGRIPHYEP